MRSLQTKFETDGIQITHVLSSAEENIISAELTVAGDEMRNSYERPKIHVKVIPEKIKKEVGIHGGDFSFASAVKKFQSILLSKAG